MSQWNAGRFSLGGNSARSGTHLKWLRSHWKRIWPGPWSDFSLATWGGAQIAFGKEFEREGRWGPAGTFENAHSSLFYVYIFKSPKSVWQKKENCKTFSFGNGLSPAPDLSSDVLSFRITPALSRIQLGLLKKPLQLLPWPLLECTATCGVKYIADLFAAWFCVGSGAEDSRFAWIRRLFSVPLQAAPGKRSSGTFRQS